MSVYINIIVNQRDMRRHVLLTGPIKLCVTAFLGKEGIGC